METVVYHSVAAGPKLLPLNPLISMITDLEKPFTPTLGLAIAPLEHPFYEGTGRLYFRLSELDQRIGLLTCAHVARPPPVSANTEVTFLKTHQRREEIIASGTNAYNDAITSMMSNIGALLGSVQCYTRIMNRLGGPVEGKDDDVTNTRSCQSSLVPKE